MIKSPYVETIQGILTTNQDSVNRWYVLQWKPQVKESLKTNTFYSRCNNNKKTTLSIALKTRRLWLVELAVTMETFTAARKSSRRLTATAELDRLPQSRRDLPCRHDAVFYRWGQCPTGRKQKRKVRPWSVVLVGASLCVVKASVKEEPYWVMVSSAGRLR